MTVPKDVQLKAPLARWFSSQNKFSSIREMSSSLSIPFNTLRGYFSGKRPSARNLRILKDVTGLDLDFSKPVKVQTNIPLFNSSSEDKSKKLYAVKLLQDLHYDLARCLTSIPPAQAALSVGLQPNKPTLKRRAQMVGLLMDAIERNLTPFLDDQKALQILRQTISGSDAGYLSGLLGSIFDERRLRTWQQLTTYEYGSK